MKQKLDLPPSVDDKVKYLIPCPNTRAKMTCIKALLNFANHGVAHSTSMLGDGLSCFPMAHCIIATQFCKEMMGDANQYMDFVRCHSWKMETWHPSSHVQGFEERVWLHQQYGVWVLNLSWQHQTLYEWQQEKYMFDWPMVPNTLLVKIGTNLLRI